MPHKDAEVRKKYQREYQREYRKSHREYCRNKQKEHKEKNREKVLSYKRELTKKRFDRRLESWKDHIKSHGTCEVCGKEICLNGGNRDSAIHFDHKKSSVAIKGNPTQWLRTRMWSVENQKIWDSCDFGTLCRFCNSRIPTDGREKFVKQVFRYVFGEDCQ